MDWLEILAAPLLVALGGLIVWYIQSRIEELRAVERSLQEDRRKVYADVLDPYIRLFTNLKDAAAQQEATKRITSYDYRKTSFDLGLFGSDEVVRAYNALMQHAYKAEAAGRQDPHEMIRLWGRLLLEIRKSLGNSSTSLDEYDMLSGMITDIESIKKS